MFSRRSHCDTAAILAMLWRSYFVSSAVLWLRTYDASTAIKDMSWPVHCVRTGITLARWRHLKYSHTPRGLAFLLWPKCAPAAIPRRYTHGNPTTLLSDRNGTAIVLSKLMWAPSLGVLCACTAFMRVVRRWSGD